MPVFRIIPLVLAFLALLVPSLGEAQGFMAVDKPAPAARNACLSRAEQRAAVVAHKAVPLAVAIRSLREHSRRAEVVRAELCRRGEGLVYVLTVLAHNGKVTRATVDATNGQPGR